MPLHFLTGGLSPSINTPSLISVDSAENLAIPDDVLNTLFEGPDLWASNLKYQLNQMRLFDEEIEETMASLRSLVEHEDFCGEMRVDHRPASSLIRTDFDAHNELGAAEFSQAAIDVSRAAAIEFCSKADGQEDLEWKAMQGVLKSTLEKADEKVWLTEFALKELGHHMRRVDRDLRKIKAFEKIDKFDGSKIDSTVEEAETGESMETECVTKLEQTLREEIKPDLKVQSDGSANIFRIPTAAMLHARKSVTGAKLMPSLLVDGAEIDDVSSLGNEELHPPKKRRKTDPVGKPRKRKPIAPATNEETVKDVEMRDPDHRKESEKFQSFGLSSSTAMLSSAEATLTNMPAKHQRSRTASGRTKGNFGPMTSTDRPTRCYSESSCLGPSSGCKNEDCPSFEVVRHEVEKVSESNAYPTPYAQQQAEDESLYCFCRQVSFGQMIGCDNEGCPIEWFHLRCVGLTQPPKGHWYCPRCLM